MNDKLHFKEWQESRDVLKVFDDRIHDLRKWGFSFLTALLAAESLLIPRTASIAVGESSIPDVTKVVVMLVTLVLIIALRLIERNYQLFIKCAAERARVLERILNLELTVIISDRHRAEGISIGENLIYIFFATGVGGLGCTILYPNFEMMIIMLFFTCVTWFAIFYIQWLSVKYLYKNKEGEKADWTIDLLECKKGDIIRIFLTNLDKKKILEMPTGVVWKIKTQDGLLIHQEEMKEKISLGPEDIYIWEWDTSKIESGIYKVYPHIPYSRKDDSLRRNIIIIK
jgi:hypothetical protein